MRREYTQVPGSLPKVVKETAEQVTKGATDNYERAVKLQNFFALDGRFTYDTSVTSGTGSAAIGRFLKAKRGFCVHFSFTMAAMARTLGIPARVAVGFTPGTGQSDGSMSVGLRDAHAWPELYFEGIGWTRFEPTPTRGSTPEYTLPDAPAGGSANPSRPQASASAAPSAAPSASDSCPPQLRRQGECGSSTAPGAAAPQDPGTPVGTVVRVVLAALLVLALLLLPLFWRVRVRKRRLNWSAGRTPADATARTLAAWQEITDTAWDHGIGPDDSLTPRKAAARVVRLGRLDPDEAAAVHRVAGAVEQVLYAPQPRAATGLAEDVETVRDGVRASADRFARIRAVVAPRSAVRVIWAASESWSALIGRWAARWRGLPRWPSRQRG